MDEQARLMAVVTADQVSSTETRVAIGELQANLVESRMTDVLREAITDSRGIYLRSTGDGAIGLFSDAASAVRCAFAMNEGAEQLSERVGVPVQFRVGIALGDIEVDLGDPSTARGMPLFVAARLCEAAAPGRSLVAESVVVSAGHVDGADIGPVMQVQGKGVGKPTRAHSISAPGHRAVLPPELTEITSGPIVGREAELDRLDTVLGEADGSRSLVVVISGAAGVGKTRLAGEVSASQRFTGPTRFVKARKGAPPYESLGAVLPAAARDVLKASSTAKIAGDQSSLFMKVLREAEQATVGAECSVIDDAHLLSPSDLDLLSNAVSTGRSNRVFVLTSRLPAAELDRRLTQTRRSVEIAVDPLSDEEVRAMARALLPPAAATQASLDAIAAGSRGMPFMVGILARETGVAEPPGRRSPSNDLVRIVEQRLEELSLTDRRAVEAVAILETTDVKFLADVLNELPADISSALDRGATSGLLVTSGSGTGFSHDLIGEAVALAARTDQPQLHRRAVQELRRDPAHDAAAVARHVLAAEERPKESVLACEAAGSAAELQAAYSTAAMWYRRSATSCENREEALRHEVRAVANEHKAGRVDARSRACALAEEARGRGDSLLAAQALFAVDRGLFSTIGVVDSAVTEVASSLIDELGDCPAQLRVQAMLASELTFGTADQVTRRRSLAADAVTRAERVEDIDERIRILTSCAMALRDSETIRERRRVCGEIDQLETDDPWLRFTTSHQLGAAALENGEVALADECVDRALAIAEQLQQPRALWIAALMETGRLIHRGRLIEADEWRRRAELHGIQAGSTLEARLPAAEQSLEIARWSDRLEVRADDLAAWAGEQSLDLTFAGLKYLALAGAHEAVHAWLRDRDTSEVINAGCPEIVRGPRLVNLATALLACGSEDYLDELYDRLSRYEGAWFQSSVSLGTTSHHLGLLALARGARDRAAGHMRLALEHHLRDHAPVWWAESVYRARDIADAIGIGTAGVESAESILSDAREQVAP